MFYRLCVFECVNIVGDTKIARAENLSNDIMKDGTIAHIVTIENEEDWIGSPWDEEHYTFKILCR